MQNKTKFYAVCLAASAAFFTSLIGYEGERLKPYRDSIGKPTIAVGATVYEDGTPVKMADPPITKERSRQIMKHHVSKDEVAFRNSIKNARLSQAEYDLYLDFVYNFGQSNWNNSSMRTLLNQGRNREACERLLLWRNAGGRDCRIRSNNCYGVWARQLDRHSKCLAVN
ncbi:glycoside hydrolase family protein [Acinetobacter haemolyticus]|uniref:glycoside hydrolase family protein n=1 Tax=Acinetobacter haemolyticus TaxID=29430 RepID=UPI000DE91205|nr:glycoside hydrolase family protein [Acinetobacter haemolyticus]WHR58398.1 glycoside hydrolase family protein [Acinetobacter haemolyticus]